VVVPLVDGLRAEGSTERSGQSVISAARETAWKFAKDIMGAKFEGPECRVKSGFGRVKLDSKAESCWLLM